MSNECLSLPSLFGKANSDLSFILKFLKEVEENKCSNACIMSKFKDHIDLFKKKTCSSMIADQTLFHFLSRYFSPELLAKIKSSIVVGKFIDFNLDSAMNKLVNVMYEEFNKYTDNQMLTKNNSKIIDNIIKNIGISKILNITRDFTEKNNEDKNVKRRFTAEQDAENSIKLFIKSIKGNPNSPIYNLPDNIRLQVENTRYYKMRMIIEIIKRNLPLNQQGGTNSKISKKNKIYTGIKGGKYYLKNNKKVYIKK